MPAATSPSSACGIVAGPAGRLADRFGHRDLDVVDMISVPERLKDAVAEPEHHDVLNRLLSEIMVDAIDLAFGQNRKDFAIELLRRAKIGAERLLDDGPAPMPFRFTGKAGLAQPPHDRGEHLWGSGEIE